MSGPVEVILIIGAVGYILARRLLGEPAEAKRMLLLPAVLAGVGLVDLTKVTQSPASIGFLVGTTVLSLVLGLLRGASIRVFDKDGIVYLRYTATTVVLWGINLGVKFGASVLLGLVDPTAEHVGSSGLMFTLGVGMVLEGLAVLSKAMRTSGRIVWAKGRNDTPHTMSSMLDGLQQKVQTADGSQTRRPRRRGGLASLIEDVRDLDIRQPNSNASAPYHGPRPNSGGSPEDQVRIIDPHHDHG
ncbi:hypothetical protein GCM10027176_52340 [Actinoallomurus bryophytorum]|uniref:DUF1453 family protein n=1 Tax=Actinoallomurus bryophytorum TaxID=1490222 RepID=A0A543CHG7_9ACTN|nr:DUF1453 domain-containing protein [Actinoallomurus bryophytorum]TQL96535.1 hypothetical protein FB559_2067 [Actinoallomurus bryophytorum]